MYFPSKLVLLSAFAALPAFAQGVTVKEDKPGLLKLAKISSEAATATALAKVPGGRVRSAEIERESGKLIYSFIIKVEGKTGVEEVNVDAVTGAIAAVEHESDPLEAKAKAATKKP